VDALVTGLQDDRIERRALSGARDRGDIAGVRVRRHRIVLECKNEATGKEFSFPDWIKQAQEEAANDGAIAGLVVHKRAKTTDATRQWVTCTVAELIAIIKAANG
jgi:hypothetical protein